MEWKNINLSGKTMSLYSNIESKCNLFSVLLSSLKKTGSADFHNDTLFLTLTLLVKEVADQ